VHEALNIGQCVVFNDRVIFKGFVDLYVVVMFPVLLKVVSRTLLLLSSWS
jgi:hypothetical protein